MSGDTQHHVLRRDMAVLAGLVPEGARVLDIGCGDGALLHYLSRVRAVDARGLELDQDDVHKAVSRGLSVVQGDADTDLVNYPSDGFDMAILSQTLQATRRPREVLKQLSRIAPKIVVSIPNFGHWRIRLTLLLAGRMPMTAALPSTWYDTENIHLCTLRDFTALARELGLEIEAMMTLDRTGKAQRRDARRLGWNNWAAEQAVFLLRRR